MSGPRSEKDAVELAASSVTGRMALWSIRHRRRVLVAWLIVLVAGLIACNAVPANTDVEEEGTGESQEAANLFEERFNLEETQPTEFLVISHPTLTVDDVGFRAVVDDLLADVRGLRTRSTIALLGTEVEASVRYVASTTSHYDIGAPRDESPFVAGLSSGGDVTFVQIELEPELEEAVDGIDLLTEAVDAAALANPAFTFVIGGDATIDDQATTLILDDFFLVSLISLPVTFLILLIGFGNVTASVVPIAMAFAAVTIAGGVMTVISRLGFPLIDLYLQVILLVGLAAGIDYAIFLVTRHRKERLAGYPELAAVVAASGTAGKAILIAATTTALALCGMFFMTSPIFDSLGLAAIVVVLVALLMALTLMPAWIAAAGDGVNRLALPFLRGGIVASESGWVFGWVAERVLRRPAVAAPLVLAAMIALAAPLFFFERGINGVRALSDDVEAKEAVLALEENFSLGLTSPAIVIVDAGEGGNVFDSGVQGAIARLQQLVEAETDPNGPYGGPIQVEVNDATDTELVEIPINADSGSVVAVDALKRLRDELVPEAFGGSGTTALVGGVTAGNADFTDLMKSRVPITVGFVVIASYLVLVVMFRSVVLPLAAVVLNILAVGAAFGVLKLTFQDGHVLEGILGYEATGLIEAWLPLFVFSVMFGISMDYLTFAMGRIKQHRQEGHGPLESVRTGIRSSATTVVAAAAIMAGVAIAFMRDLGLKQFGTVILDTTVILAILMPSVLLALGDKLWYFPSWLSWVPEVSVDDRGLREAYPALRPRGG